MIKTIGVHDSYRENFTLLVVITEETKVGGVTIVESSGLALTERDQVELQYTMGEVDVSASLQDS